MIFKKLHFTGTVDGKNHIITKAEVCKNENIDIFIDDHINNVINVSLTGIPSILLDQPWNKDEVLPNNVKRLYSWEEIVMEIDQTLL